MMQNFDIALDKEGKVIHLIATANLPYGDKVFLYDNGAVAFYYQASTDVVLIPPEQTLALHLFLLENEEKLLKANGFDKPSGPEN